MLPLIVSENPYSSEMERMAMDMATRSRAERRVTKKQSTRIGVKDGSICVLGFDSLSELIVSSISLIRLFMSSSSKFEMIGCVVVYVISSSSIASFECNEERLHDCLADELLHIPFLRGLCTNVFLESSEWARAKDIGLIRPGNGVKTSFGANPSTG